MKTRTNPFLFISLLLLGLLFTCQKDENVPLDQFKLISEEVNATATTAQFKVYYVYGQNKPCKLDHVTICFDKNSELGSPRRSKCELKEDEYGTYFMLNLSELEAKTTYYYYYEVANAINAMNTEVESFTTNDYGTPTVTTVSVTNVTGSGAKFNGTVNNDGELTVTERGFCYGTNSSSLYVSGLHVTAGSGLGNFSANVTGLSSNTTYYVRAYARNSKGVGYGNVKSFTTTNGLPTVTTNNVSNITSSSATCGGNITSDGGFALTVKGVCWSTSQNPTVNGSHTSNGTATGAYSGYMTGLTPGTTYYVRAYATNSVGTAYGVQRSFTTSVYCPSTVADYDGNTYNTVLIGNQCWMKENLRTTHYANGVSIPLGSTTSTTTAYRYYPYDNDNNYISYISTLGYLYNWPAVMHGASSSNSNPSGVQGICPNGWHVPSDAEWTQLTNYVRSQPQYLCNGNSANIAKALASTNWGMPSSYPDPPGVCAVGNNPSSNNATGFSARGAGSFGSESGYPFANALFWSATWYSDGGAGCHYLDNFSTDLKWYYHSEYYGASVRCVCD